jgi:hypothetical protein
MPTTTFGSGRGRRGYRVRELRKWPLLAAVALPVLLAVFGTALVGNSGLEWYEELEKPSFLVPLGIFYLVGPSTTRGSPLSSTASCPASRTPGKRVSL